MRSICSLFSSWSIWIHWIVSKKCNVGFVYLSQCNVTCSITPVNCVHSHWQTHTNLPLQPFALFRIDFRSELSSAKFLSLHLLSKRFLSDIYGGRRQKRGWVGLLGAERDGSRGREETAILVFHVKQQWITEAGLAFLRNTVSVIQAVITVLIMLAPHSTHILVAVAAVAFLWEAWPHSI